MSLWFVGREDGNKWRQVLEKCEERKLVNTYRSEFFLNFENNYFLAIINPVFLRFLNYSKYNNVYFNLNKFLYFSGMKESLLIYL